MNISAILYDKVTVKVASIKKTYNFKNCMVIFKDGSLSLREFGLGIETGNSLGGLGSIVIKEMTPWGFELSGTGHFSAAGNKLVTVEVIGVF